MCRSTRDVFYSLTIQLSRFLLEGNLGSESAAGHLSPLSVENNVSGSVLKSGYTSAELSICEPALEEVTLSVAGHYDLGKIAELELYYNVLRTIVKYVGESVGDLFVYSGEGEVTDSACCKLCNEVTLCILPTKDIEVLLSGDSGKSLNLIGYGVGLGMGCAVNYVGDGVLDSNEISVEVNIIGNACGNGGNDLFGEHIDPSEDLITGNGNVIKRLKTGVLEELTCVNNVTVKVVEDLVGNVLTTNGTDTVYEVVAESCNNLLSNEDVVTNRALNACSKTGGLTSGSNCLERLLGMTESFNENILTYGTDLIVGTVSRSACGVTESVYRFLRNGNDAANGALLTCGKTGGLTSGSNCLKVNLGVAESGSKHYLTYGTDLSIGTICCCACSVTYSVYRLLRNGNDAANGALLTCGKTGGLTSGSNCLKVNLCVTLSSNECRSGDGYFTNRALNACGVTVIGTSSGDLFNYNLGVTESRIDNCATYGTGLSNKTACCLAGNVLAGSFDNYLSYENLVTYGTVRTFGKTGLTTVGSNCVVDHYGVSCGDYGLSNGDLTTSVTLLTFGKTISGTGSCYCLKNGNVLVRALPLSSKSYVSEYLISGEVPLLLAVIPTNEVVAILGRIEGLLNETALLYGLSVYSGAILAVEGYIELFNNSGPLSDKGNGLGYGALSEVPGLTAKIPTVEGVALFGGSLGLGSERILLNHLRGNLGAALTVELYFERFYLGRSADSKGLKQATGSESEYYSE